MASLAESRRLLVAGIALLTVACRAEVNVLVDINDDRSGTVAFEFGLDDNGRLHLIDEALTPDSSRFWPADQYRPGISPPSFDKQFVRDYLETLDWDKTPPGPALPATVIAQTAEKYREAQIRLTA